MTNVRATDGAARFGETPTNKIKFEIRVGQSGWTLPKAHAADFPESGTHLQRYAQRFTAVEINSSFYRPHRQATYVRWAASVPVGFKFAVKIPKAITHEGCLQKLALLSEFLGPVRGLGSALGPLLVQLPPRLSFSKRLAARFFTKLRRLHGGDVVCEPRNGSWFTQEANEVLKEFRVARVAADPDRDIPLAGTPGGWDGLSYFRLHGSPRIYYSDYATERLERLAESLDALTARGPVWCIFDNTALGYATANGLWLRRHLGR